MDLNELFPRSITLKLSNKAKYKLNKWTLADKLWLSQEYTKEEIDVLFVDPMNIDAIARIAYRMIKDKRDFAKVERSENNEQGEKINYFIGGYKLLLSEVVGDIAEINLVNSVLDCIAVSSPKPSGKKKVEIQ